MLIVVKLFGLHEAVEFADALAGFYSFLHPPLFTRYSETLPPLPRNKITLLPIKYMIILIVVSIL